MRTTETAMPATRASATFLFDLTEMRPDELYAGVVRQDGGDYHLILLPGEAHGVTWQEAKVFAAVVGGQLPSLNEQAIMMQNVRDEFPWQGAYWLSDSYDSGHSFFFDVSARGSCDYEKIDARLRTRAVRRVPAVSEQQRQRGGAR